MAKPHSKEGGNHLAQESIRQKTMEGIDGGAICCNGWTKPGSKSQGRRPDLDMTALLHSCILPCSGKLSLGTGVARVLHVCCAVYR